MSGEQHEPERYTPTMEEVRGIYAAHGFGGNRAPDGQHQSIAAWRAEFDRWLAAHDSEVATRNYALGQQDPVRALPDRETIAPMTEAIEELVVWAACQQAPDDTIPAQTEAEARRRWHAWLAARDAAARAAMDRDVLEQAMFKHQPVMSMRDGSIAGCQCMDRVFTGSEEWGTHLADAVLALFGQEGR